MLETIDPASRLATLMPHYPVVIINGCGLFRDLCAQGVDCLLVERFGTRAEAFVEALGAEPAIPLRSLSVYGTRELQWSCRTGHA